jgi:hypothetical protein
VIATRAHGILGRLVIAVTVATLAAVAWIEHVRGRDDAASPFHIGPAVRAHLSELARPVVTPARSDDLVAASRVVERQRWRSPNPDAGPIRLADYPQASTALAKAIRWAGERGGLPLYPMSKTSMHLFTLGRVMIGTATASEPRALDAAAYLGYRMVAEGSDLLDALLGSTLLESAFERARALGVSTAAWSVPADGEVIRVLAAEAQADDRARYSPPDPKPLVAALDSARPHEPDAIAIVRLRVVSANHERRRFAQLTVELATRLDRIRRTSRSRS